MSYFENEICKELNNCIELSIHFRSKIFVLPLPVSRIVIFHAGKSLGSKEIVFPYGHTSLNNISALHTVYGRMLFLCALNKWLPWKNITFYLRVTTQEINNFVEVFHLCF